MTKSTKILSIIALLTLAACAPGDTMYHAASLAGFWSGLWHGMIVWFTFVISLFYDSVQVYEAANNGGWYDGGFVLGIGIWGIGIKITGG